MTLIGGIVGWTVTMGIAFLTLGLGVFLAGLIVGAGVGIAEALVLLWIKESKGRFSAALAANIVCREPMAWVALTILGLHLCLVTTGVGPRIIAVFAPTIYANEALRSISSFFVAGAIFGFVQWFGIRKLHGSLWWIPMSMLAWYFGSLTGNFVATLVTEQLLPGPELFGGMGLGAKDLLFNAIVGSIGTAIFAAMSGIVFTYLLSTYNVSEGISKRTTP